MNTIEQLLTLRRETHGPSHSEDDGCLICESIKTAMGTTAAERPMDHSWALVKEPVDEFDYSDEARELVEVA